MRFSIRYPLKKVAHTEKKEKVYPPGQNSYSFLPYTITFDDTQLLPNGKQPEPLRAQTSSKALPLIGRCASKTFTQKISSRDRNVDSKWKWIQFELYVALNGDRRLKFCSQRTVSTRGRRTRNDHDRVRTSHFIANLPFFRQKSMRKRLIWIRESILMKSISAQVVYSE